MSGVTGFLGALVQFISIFLISMIGLFMLGVAAYTAMRKLLFKKFVQKGFIVNRQAILLVKIPPTNEQKEDAMEEFLLSLHRLLPRGSRMSFELVSSEQFLRFYIVTTKSAKTIVESQLYAQFPDAEIEEGEDYLAASKTAATAIRELKFKKSSVNPLKTYKDVHDPKTAHDDLLKSLSAILAKTEPSEKVVLQLALQTVGGKSYQRGSKGFFYDLFGKKGTEEAPSVSYQKMTQDLYAGTLRVAYMAKDSTTARAKLETLLGLFKLVKGANSLAKRSPLLPDFLPQAFNARLFEHGDFWSCAEIATIYHFPYKGTVVANVVQTTSKRAPAPDVLPILGQIDPQTVSFFGETNYRNDQKVFGIKRFDRRRHLYVVGKTGSGKSRLLQLLLIADIQTNNGCCLLDPHGDLTDDLLKYVPKHRIDDVVYVDPSDRNFPIGFNPLEPVQDYEARQHLSTFFIAIFKKMFAANWTPRMEHLVRYITLALLETEDSSVLGIPRMLSDTAFRQRVVMQIKDPVVKGFWTNEFSTGDQQFSAEAVIPILNKVGQFISNPIIRNMVGQRKNVLDFSKFMDEGKIVLLNLSKGKLGDDNASLLGSMIITKIQQAALARAKMPEEQRRDFYFYVDEFQNFATDAFSSILSEARKYHLNLTIAHQYIAQLPDEVKATAFGNVGSIVTFAIGGDDAAYLAKEFAPTFTPDDMINLNSREMYIKMSIDGKLTPPFSGRTINTPASQVDYTTDIKDKSRVKYSRNRVMVENEIVQWSSSAQNTSVGSGEENFPEPII